MLNLCTLLSRTDTIPIRPTTCEELSKLKYFSGRKISFGVQNRDAGSYEPNIRSGASTTLSAIASKTVLKNIDFWVPIQAISPGYQHIVASGIFGNIRSIVWRVTFFLLIRF